MNERDSSSQHRPQHFFNLSLAGRVVGLDLMRGFAIFAMTAYHQSIVIPPDGVWRLFSGFLGFISAPLFLTISGAAVAFHERRYHWPFKMIVHGGLLFVFMYLLDVFVNRSWQVDWDVFQIIGACYAGLGLLDYLGYGLSKLFALAALLLCFLFLPALRPDKGIFPFWPFGLYFIGGYLLSLLGQSLWLRRWLIWGLAIAGFVYFFASFTWNPTPDRTRFAGLAFLFSMTYLLLLMALEMEKRGLLKTPCLAVLVRWGKFPLTIYFMQQFVTVAHLRLPLPLLLTGAWMVQSVVLLALLYAATFLMERYAFLDVGWWLRQAEQRVMKRTPDVSLLGPNRIV